MGCQIRHPTLLTRVVDQLAADMERFVDAFPSLGALSVRYGASRRTVSKAAHLLAERGLLTVSQGRTIRKLGPPQTATAPPRRPSCTRVSDVLADQIGEGRLRSGQPLPKIAFFVREFRVSNGTIVAAFRELEKAGLVHKVGRTWIVGPPTKAPTDHVAVKGSPVILLAMGRADAWRWLYTAERTSRFCASFVQEAERLDVELVPVLVHETPYQGDLASAGLQSTMELIRQLGPRYAGMLIAGRRSELPELRQWIETMGAGNRPTVWFDALDEPLEFDVPRNFTRCHFSESSGTEAVVRHLEIYGHRDAAYVIAVPDPWVRHRFELLCQQAVGLGTGLHFTALDSIEGDAVYPRITRHAQLAGLVSELLPSMARDELTGGLTQPAARKLNYGTDVTGIQLITASRHLLPLLEHPAITAVVACNDIRAVRYYVWLNAMGLQMSHDISLISFDNSIRLSPHPISSVDFGFGNLGYCAFHLIVRDIPIRCDRRGQLSARARVIDRGSVGSARKHSLPPWPALSPRAITPDHDHLR